jgi:glycosyltransferase involved in cell wall biosynthesis
MDDCAQILDAASVLQGRGRGDIRIALIGDGSERRALESQAEKAELRQVSFVGLLPKVDVVGWLEKATCALVIFEDVPVLATSSPNKLFDALAAGVPVIQNTQGWIKDLLAEYECGLTVRADDAVALAEATEKLCDDKALRNRMGENARRVAEGMFDRNLLAERMRNVLLEAAAE